MRNKRRGALKEEGGAGGAPGPRPRLGMSRTSVMTVLLGVLVALSGARAQSAAQEDVVIVGEAMGGGAGLLEASMTSSLLMDLEEAAVATDTAEAPPPAGATAAQTAAFPDSSAVVGRAFQMKLPAKMSDHPESSAFKVRRLPYETRYLRRVSLTSLRIPFSRRAIPSDRSDLFNRVNIP